MNTNFVSVAIGAWALALSLLNGCAAADCESVCLEAQARACTVITNCNTFCSDVNTLADNAGCRAEADALDRCSTSVDACEVDARCGGEENALASCAVPYCLANPGARECQL
mgnify:FL=1